MWAVCELCLYQRRSCQQVNSNERLTFSNSFAFVVPHNRRLIRRSPRRVTIVYRRFCSIVVSMLRFLVFRFQFLILLSIFTFIILLQFTDEDVKYHKFTSVGKLEDDEPVDDRNIFFINTSDTTSGIDLKPLQACAVESAGESSLGLPNMLQKVIYSLHEPGSASLRFDYHTAELPRLPCQPVRSRHSLISERAIEALRRHRNHQTHATWTMDSQLDLIQVDLSRRSLVGRLPARRALEVSRNLLGHGHDDAEELQAASTELCLCREWSQESNRKRFYGSRHCWWTEVYRIVFDVGESSFIELEQFSYENYSSEIMRSYDRDLFTQTGPEMITRVLMTLCDKRNVDEMSSDVCEGFNVLAQRKCSNLNYEDWDRFFDEKSTEEAIEALNDSHIVHFWSSQSDSKVFRSETKSAFNVLGKIHCPRVMQHVGEFVTWGDESKMHENVIVSSFVVCAQGGRNKYLISSSINESSLSQTELEMGSKHLANR